MTSSATEWFKRPFKILPEEASSQTGITIVTILFGLVISKLALDFASQFAGIVNGIPYNDEEDLGVEHSVTYLDWKSALRQRDLALLHLLVAASLTITSAIGYYTSRNLPRLKIQFFNKSFCQFVLDVSMVFTYYLVIEFTEPTWAEKSAAPETLLVLVAFILYAIWDITSFMTSRDPLDQLALRQTPRQAISLGSRRKTTFAFMGLVAVLTLSVNLFDLNSDVAIILIDLSLIAILFSYRITKISFYPSRMFRGGVEADQSSYEPYEGTLDEASVKQVLPAIVFRNLSFIRTVSEEIEQKGDISNSYSVLLDNDQTQRSRLMLISSLIDAGIFLPVTQDSKDKGESENMLEIELTDFGRAVASINIS